MKFVSEKLFIVFRQFVIYCLLFCLNEAKHCGYRLSSPEHRSHVHAYRHHEPRDIGIKECTWGCCWDKKEDVCCSFPMEIVPLGFLSALSGVILIAVVVSIVKCLSSRVKRICVHSSGCRQGSLDNFTLVTSCPSTNLHHSYVHLDAATLHSETQPVLESASHASDSQTTRWKSQDKQSGCLIFL